ncbi:uncharacterized protein LOC143883674 isoform X2 [Tasmannia lanceolata]|uniref:uncharacterized protein LOC143883674 isoform X2 n=1 Tax=Tasmannia lanceolata TaxID=3420 RepID=UPI00406481D1
MSKGKQKKERRELLRFCLPKSSSSSPFLSFAVSVVLPAKNPLRRTPHPIKEAEVFRRSHPCTLQSHLLQSKRWLPSCRKKQQIGGWLLFELQR